MCRKLVQMCVENVSFGLNEKRKPQRHKKKKQTEPHDDNESQEADSNKGIENDERMKKKQISNSFFDMMLEFKNL